MTRRKSRILLGSLALVVVLLAAVLSGALERSVVGDEIDQSLTAEQMRELVPKGRVLADLADCYGCHANASGGPWAGGLAFETPFGAIHVTNISPDKEFGIGGWTRAEFHRAVRDGIGKGGSHLYPAMPYASYRAMTPEDVDAIYAFLMSREPIPQANRPNTLPFPFNFRPTLAFWNLLNLPREPFPREPGKSAEWSRGSYLANVLGHCGECHTPRGLTKAMAPARHFQGAELAGIDVPDITPTGLAALGFDRASLVRYMRDGLAPQGAALHQMFEVVHFSTQHWSDADLAALATYLLGDPAPAQVAIEPAALKPEVAEAGKRTYLAVCAGCHGLDGEGVPHVAVPMKGNVTLRLENPQNFLTAVMHGLPEHDFPGLERMQAMPGFADVLTDQEAADLTTWARARWGGRAEVVTPAMVAQLRH